MKKPDKKKIFRILQIVFVIAVVVFMTRYFYININRIRELNFKINWPVFLLSMLFYFAYKLTLSLLWHYITILNHSDIPVFDAVVSYLYSILGKYIPGKVFMLAARFPAYEKRNVPLSKVTVDFLIENVCTILGASFIFLISIFGLHDPTIDAYRPVAVILVVLFFICLHPKIINFFLGIFEKITKKNNLKIDFSYLQMLKVVVLFILNWMIVGTGFYILSKSMWDIPVGNLMYVGGIYGLSAVAGILALFAPSGIGVREGVMVLGLSVILPQEIAVIISVVSRLWQSVAEIILILFAMIISHIRKGKRREINHPDTML